MNKEAIYQKAVDIINKKEKERLHNKTCIKAGICPECGEELVTSSDTENIYNDESIAEITHCSKNRKHYEYIIYEDTEEA